MWPDVGIRSSPNVSNNAQKGVYLQSNAFHSILENCQIFGSLFVTKFVAKNFQKSPNLVTLRRARDLVQPINYFIIYGIMQKKFFIGSWQRITSCKKPLKVKMLQPGGDKGKCRDFTWSTHNYAACLTELLIEDKLTRFGDFLHFGQLFKAFGNN